MHRSVCSFLAAAGLIALFATTPAHAQPFGKPGSFLSTGPGDGYVEVPSSSALNVARDITIEFWARDERRENGCVSFVSKGLMQYWVGHCHDGQMRTYLGDFRRACEAGTIPRDGFPHHFAMTYDGNARRHYIDGELVGVCNLSETPPANAQPLRFFFNPLADAHTPINGLLFEVRLWNVARSQAQIRQTITREIDAPMPGLVGVWHLRDDARDAVGGHHGGAPQAGARFDHFTPGTLCSTSSVGPCLLGRLSVFTTFLNLTAPDAQGVRRLNDFGTGTLVPGASTDSGLFWFFAPANWEVLVKAVNACSFNNRLWVFSAATTDQHYALWVLDNPTASVKVYFNYAGAPAPAVTDTAAFATCP